MDSKKDSPNETILIADDDPEILEFLTLLLKAKYKILQAKDGEEALRLAHETLPHLVVLDMMMPRLSGLEVVRELQADSDTRAIPVILITARNLDESTKTILRDNVNVASFLNKPCDCETLTRQVRAALDRRIADGLDDLLTS